MSTYDAKYYEENGSSGDRIALGWYERLVGRYAPAGPALDLGAGPGWLMRRLSRSRSCDGVEISEYSRRECRLRNPRAQVFPAIAQVPANRYAAVTAIHVLEHIPMDEIPATMAEIVRVLMPGGVLLMVTPDADGRAARLRGEAWRAYSDPTHINLQGHEHWRRTLVRSKLTVVQEGSDGLWDPPYTSWLADRMRLPRIAFDVLRGRMTMLPGTGESYLAVAMK